MFCANCGSKNEADAKFCFNCGHPISNTASREAATGRRPVPAATSQPGSWVNRTVIFSVLGLLIVAGVAFWVVSRGGAGGSGSPHTQGRLFIADGDADEFDLYWDYPGQEPTSEPIARDVVGFGELCLRWFAECEVAVHYRDDGGGVAYVIDEDGEGALVWTESGGQVSLMTDWDERRDAVVYLVPTGDWVGLTYRDSGDDEYVCSGGRGGEQIRVMLSGDGNCFFTGAGAYLLRFSPDQVNFHSWEGNAIELLDDGDPYNGSIGEGGIALALADGEEIVIFDTRGNERSIEVNGRVEAMLLNDSDGSLVYGVTENGDDITWYHERGGVVVEIGRAEQGELLDVDGTVTLVMRDRDDDYTVWPADSPLAGFALSGDLGGFFVVIGAVSWRDGNDRVIWRTNDRTPHEFEGSAELLEVGPHQFVVDEDGLWSWPRGGVPVELADSGDYRLCARRDGLGTSVFTSNFVTTDGKNFYFVTCDFGGGDAAIWSVPVDGSEVPTEIEDGFELATNLYVRDRWLYYTTHDNLIGNDFATRRYDLRGNNRPENAPHDAIPIPPSLAPVELFSAAT